MHISLLCGKIEVFGSQNRNVPRLFRPQGKIRLLTIRDKQMLGSVIQQLQPQITDCSTPGLFSQYCESDIFVVNLIFFALFAASIGLFILGLALRWRYISKDRKSSLSISSLTAGIMLAAIIPLLVLLPYAASLPTAIAVIIILWRLMRRYKQIEDKKEV